MGGLESILVQHSVEEVALAEGARNGKWEQVCRRMSNRGGRNWWKEWRGLDKTEWKKDWSYLVVRSVVRKRQRSITSVGQPRRQILAMQAWHTRMTRMVCTHNRGPHQWDHGPWESLRQIETVPLCSLQRQHGSPWTSHPKLWPPGSWGSSLYPHWEKGEE